MWLNEAMGCSSTFIRSQWNNTWKILKENYFNVWILYTAKLSIRLMWIIDSFLKECQYQKMYIRGCIPSNKGVHQERWRHEIQGPGAPAQASSKGSPWWQLGCRPLGAKEPDGAGGWRAPGRMTPGKKWNRQINWHVRPGVKLDPGPLYRGPGGCGKHRPDIQWKPTQRPGKDDILRTVQLSYE